MMETVAREQMMDHVAAEIGIDPIEFRRRNIIHQSDLPYTTCTTLVYDVVTPEETLDQAMEMLDLAKFRAEQEKARAEGRLLGLGVGHLLLDLGINLLEEVRRHVIRDVPRSGDAGAVRVQDVFDPVARPVRVAGFAAAAGGREEAAGARGGRGGGGGRCASRTRCTCSSRLPTASCSSRTATTTACRC
jgi:hypothetical protein